MDLARIEDAIEAMSAGRMVILVDDEDRENEGDLVVSAEACTAEHVNFMAEYGRGLICVALAPERVDGLALSPMASRNNAPLGTAFTRSVDLVEGGGIGASGRAATMRALADPNVGPAAFRTPGPVMPLRARHGGVLVRSGQTEGSVDLARLAGHAPAGVICEVMSPDGAMTRLPGLLEFGEQYDIPVVTVADLIRYRLGHERLVRCVSQAELPTEYGPFRMHCYENSVSGQVHVALTLGDLTADQPRLVRVHRADTVGDVFGSVLGGGRHRLTSALKAIADEGAGVVLYLRPEGEEAMDERIRHYGAAARGERVPRFAATMGFHDFGVGAQILGDLGLRKLRVMTSKPMPFKGLSGFGLEIVEWVPGAARAAS